MMGIDRFDPANLAYLLFLLACLHRSLHSKVSIVFAWIGTAPIRLAGIGFQHHSILLVYPCITYETRCRE
ncbi:hypothetical protein GGE67_006092 [Rhizobium leucaenae]|nr:hypothetical protein [Rhizobium leucaenae]